MPRKVSREVLIGFVEEAKSYLPTIRERINEIRADPTRLEVLEEAHRHIHTIKGASSMVGLAALSHMAYYVEETIEEIAAQKLLLGNQTLSFLNQALAQIEVYLDGLVSGNLHERPLLVELTRSYRRLRGLPEKEDGAAVEKVLAQVSGAPTFGADEADFPPPPPVPRPTAAPPPVPVVELAPEQVSGELLEAFLLEAEDHLRNVYNVLGELQKQPEQHELLQNVRRSVHTLKGAAGAIGFRSIAQLSHRMEDLLDLLYNGKLVPDSELLDLLFDSTDALQDLAEGNVPAEEMRPPLQRLYKRYNEQLKQLPAPTMIPADLAHRFRLEPLGEEPILDLSGLAADDEQAGEKKPAFVQPRQPSQVVRVPIERLDELVRLVSELVISRTTFEQRMSGLVRTSEEMSLSTDRLRRISTTLETQYEVQALGGWAPYGGTSVQDSGPQPASLKRSEFDELELDRYTEFHRLLRELSETTGDVNTLGNELNHLIGDFDGILNRQRRLSSELQEKLMRVRMVPLAALATRLHRAVRVLARDQGKQIELLIEGEDIELDKTVLEAMADPLLHLLRNAVDHGIEPPALRQVTGKPEHGRILLQAYYEGNQVVIQVQDDGAGLEPQLLRAAAVSKGYASSAEASQLSKQQLYNMVFLPGFSTASQVSEVSGRGVGLDIVRTNVQKLKGTVTLDSTPSQGTTFTIRLPMTLAVTRALLVRAHQETFALPLGAVTQILRLERDELEKVGQEPVVRVGQQVYPMLRLGEVLNLKQPADETVTRLPVLILNAEGKQVAIVVDQIVAGQEIVIKSLGNHLRRVQGVTGATLMGDGSVVLILNPTDLVGEPAAVTESWTTMQALGVPETWSIMVVDDSVSVRRVVSNLIKSAGWRPVTARDGVDALEQIQRSAQPPDLILLDIEMPRMDGYELLAMLRGQAAYHDVPVVMLTSRAGDKHRQKALDMGASEYLVKPYQDQVLINTVRRLVQVARQTVGV